MTLSDKRWPATASPLAPSGSQVRIARDGHEAVVTEVGATLRSYTVDGVAQLDGFDAAAPSDSGRGQVLAPWPNRIEDGSYRFAGSTHQLGLDEVEARNAIHGLVRWLPWEVADRGPDRVVMAMVLHPSPGYPFTVGLTITYALEDDGLSVTARAANLGDSALPFGLGFHPYLTVGTPKVDETVLSVPAATALRANDRGIPVGSSSVEGSDLDFRGAGRTLGAARLDTCFTDLERGSDGLARATLRHRDGGRSLTVFADPSFTHLMVFTGDTLEARVRRRGLAVEPMTCPPNAFRTGDGVIVLEPLQETSARWGLQPS